MLRPGPEWHVRESYNDELASLRLGSYTDVAWVLPNPLPEPLAAEGALLNLLDRGSFVGLLLASGYPATDRLLPALLRPETETVV